MLAIGVFGSGRVNDVVVGAEEAEEQGDEGGDAEGGYEGGVEGVCVELGRWISGGGVYEEGEVWVGVPG